MWLVRLILCYLLVVPGFMATGGHPTILWQPFAILMSLGVFASYYFAIVGIRLPPQVLPSVLHEVGKRAVWPAALIPSLLGFAHASEYLTAGVEKIGQLVSAALISPIFALLIYVVWFAPYAGQASTLKTEDPPNLWPDQVIVPQTRMQLYVYVTHGLSFLGFVMIFGFIVIFADNLLDKAMKKDPLYTSWQIEDEVRARAFKDEDVFIAKNCKRWTHEQRSDRENDLKKVVVAEFEAKYRTSPK